MEKMKRIGGWGIGLGTSKRMGVELDMYVVPDYYCLCTCIRYESNQEYRMGGRMMELILRSSSVEWLFCLVWWIIIRNADERKSSNVW